MRITMLCLAVWLLLADFGRLNGDCKIPKKCQVENPEQGLCMWCSIETVGNYYKNKKTKGIVRQHWDETNGCTFDRAVGHLDKIEVHYSLIRPKYSLNTVKAFTDSKAPIIAGTKRSSYLGRHVIIITHITDDKVYFIDSNFPGNVYRYDAAYFNDEVWDGEGLYIWEK